MQSKSILYLFVFGISLSVCSFTHSLRLPKNVEPMPEDNCEYVEKMKLSGIEQENLDAQRQRMDIKMNHGDEAELYRKKEQMMLNKTMQDLDERESNLDRLQAIQNISCTLALVWKTLLESQQDPEFEGLLQAHVAFLQRFIEVEKCSILDVNLDERRMLDQERLPLLRLVFSEAPAAVASLCEITTRGLSAVEENSEKLAEYLKKYQRQFVSRLPEFEINSQPLAGSFQNKSDDGNGMSKDKKNSKIVYCPTIDLDK